MYQSDCIPVALEHILIENRANFPFSALIFQNCSAICGSISGWLLLFLHLLFIRGWRREDARPQPPLLPWVDRGRSSSQLSWSKVWEGSFWEAFILLIKGSVRAVASPLPPFLFWKHICGSHLELNNHFSKFKKIIKPGEFIQLCGMIGLYLKCPFSRPMGRN